MAIQGPRNSQNLDNATGVGNIAWDNPSRAQASDDSRADASLTFQTDVTNFLRARKFRFSIPSGRRILGIRVDFEKSATSRIQDNIVRLLKASNLVGSNKAKADNWPGTDEYITYGSGNDRWGTSWTPAQINSNGFGVVISAKTDVLPAGRPFVDHVRIRVTFSNPPPPPVPSTIQESIGAETIYLGRQKILRILSGGTGIALG